MKRLLLIFSLLLVFSCEDKKDTTPLPYVQCKWFRYCGTATCHTMHLSNYKSQAPASIMMWESSYIHFYEDEKRLEFMTVDGKEYHKDLSTSGYTFSFSRL